MNKIHPWHQQNWQTLTQRYQRRSLPHALLLHGAPGLGKLNFATRFAQFLLCNGNANPTQNIACDSCKSCALFCSDNHPDFFLIQPQTEGTAKNAAIKIEQIRELINDVGNTSHQGGLQIVVINPADKMNAASANALLKTLEEPASAATVIILISSQPTLLPATILSRCQKVEFKTPDKSVGLAWLRQQAPAGIKDEDIAVALQLAHYAPLAALDLLTGDKLPLRKKILADLLAYLRQSILNENRFLRLVQIDPSSLVLGEAQRLPTTGMYKYILEDCGQTLQQSIKPKCEGSIDVSAKVEEYTDVEPNFLLNIFISVADDCVKCKLQAADSFITNQDYFHDLQELSAQCSLERLLDYQKELLEIKKILAVNIALNKQLLSENLWLGLKGVL